MELGPQLVVVVVVLEPRLVALEPRLVALVGLAWAVAMAYPPELAAVELYALDQCIRLPCTGLS
jgi:hypothetical protein